MPITTLDPTSAGTYTQWTEVGGVRSTLVSDNNDATYIRGVASALRDSYQMDNLPAAAAGGGVIRSVKSRNRGKYIPGCLGHYIFVRLDGTDGSNLTIGMTDSWAWWVSATHSRPGGGSWTVANVNAVEAGVRARTVTDSGDTYCSEIELQVNWSPATSGWRCLVVCFLGPVLGAGLQLSDMPALISAFNRATRGKHIIHSHEALTMFNDLRANPHRHHLFLGKAA